MTIEEMHQKLQESTRASAGVQPPLNAEGNQTRSEGEMKMGIEEKTENKPRRIESVNEYLKQQAEEAEAQRKNLWMRVDLYRDLVNLVLKGFDDLGAIKALDERTPISRRFLLDRLKQNLDRLSTAEGGLDYWLEFEYNSIPERKPQ
jgi:hypothetical protein